MTSTTLRPRAAPRSVVRSSPLPRSNGLSRQSTLAVSARTVRLDGDAHARRREGPDGVAVQAARIDPPIHDWADGGNQREDGQDGMNRRWFPDANRVSASGRSNAATSVAAAAARFGTVR